MGDVRFRSIERGRRPRGDEGRVESDAALGELFEKLPRWSRRLWGTPLRRLGFSTVFISIAVWILVYALIDPVGYFGERRAIGGFIAAPALLILFGAQATQALLDLVHRRNSFPILNRIGPWLDRRGLVVVVVYLVAMVAALFAVWP
jgi:hypothetical protein